MELICLKSNLVGCGKAWIQANIYLAVPEGGLHFIPRDVKSELMKLQ